MLKKDTQVKRNSNIEILRILCMFLIVLHHVVVHGLAYGNGTLNSTASITINQFIIKLMSMGGKMGVDLFVLISGYFLVNSKFKLKKVFELESQVLTYSVGIALILFSLGISDITLKNIIKSIFPITYNSY